MNLCRARTRTAPYFRDCLSAADLDELNIEIIRNTLYKSYLEDFHAYCLSLGDPTSEVMSNILSFEADRRTINITVNSLGTALSKEQRASLFPKLGKLYPAGNNVLARADEVDQVRQVVEMVPEYREFFTASASKAFTGTEDGSSGNVAENLEDHFFRVSTVVVF